MEQPSSVVMTILLALLFLLLLALVPLSLIGLRSLWLRGLRCGRKRRAADFADKVRRLLAGRELRLRYAYELEDLRRLYWLDIRRSPWGLFGFGCLFLVLSGLRVVEFLAVDSEVNAAMGIHAIVIFLIVFVLVGMAGFRMMMACWSLYVVDERRLELDEEWMLWMIGGQQLRLEKDRYCTWFEWEDLRRARWFDGGIELIFEGVTGVFLMRRADLCWAGGSAALWKDVRELFELW